MRNSASLRQNGPPREGEARTIFVGAKVRTLLRSVGVLDGWLEQNEGRSENVVRVRRMKRWREEALEQLRLELNRTRT